MLFVFQVDTGHMHTFDMTFALDSVQKLKSHVEVSLKIPVDKQVLLVSGGVYLRTGDRVCSYMAGTDTNPIYLFSKTVIESYVPPAAKIDIGSEPGNNIDVASKVRESFDWPPTYNTVQERLSLAKDLCDYSQTQQTTCENLVHEQHLQQQGWSAVVANLEDLSSDLKVRWQLYQEAFSEYISKRDSYLDFLTHFKDDLLILQKIPVLPALIESQSLIVPDDDDEEDDDDDNFGENKKDSVKDRMTLLEWISQRDDFMDSLFDICSKGLIQTDEEEFRLLQIEVEQNLRRTDDVNMKEIKGLGDRLCGLESLMADMKRHVIDQMKLTESFQRNHNRASQLKDASVLPDICTTHQQQLNVMLENYNHIRSITHRIILAKNELSSNLYHRLKWIVFMEDSLSELDNKLVFNYQNLLSLQRQLEILQQVHTAPATYLSTIVEVVRRRKITQAFLLWASDVACNMLTIYNEEIARRKDFQSQIEGHFLSSLFPGMSDLPPTFATQAPSIFDSSLPKLTEDDVESLKRVLPEMADSLYIPDTSLVTNYFMLKEATKEESDKKTVEDKLIEVVAEAGLTSNLDQNILKAIETEVVQTTPHGLPHLKDLDRGCESETDTEEFEKVGQSPFDLHFDKTIPSPRPGTQDASTLTSEDNLQISRSEYERLKSAVLGLSQIGREEFTQLRSELSEAKKFILEEKASALNTCTRLRTSFDEFLHETEDKERQIVQRMTVDHELEIIDFRKISQSKNEEIKDLRDTNVSNGRKISDLAMENADLRRRIAAVEEARVKEVDEIRGSAEESLADKERSMKETTERLKGEHKSELENIRARFKLMTMERSPSENSLEKIERGEFTSLTNHEALLLQMTENFESEKEIAVSDAVAKENLKWEKILEERVQQMEENFQQEKTFLLRDFQDEQEQEQGKQIEELREQIINLSLECVKYKDTIQQLTEFRDDSDDRMELLRKIELLAGENAELRQEVLSSRSLTDSGMVASVVVCEGAATSDAATSPVKIRKRSEYSSSSTSTSSPKIGRLNVDSCRPGELVLVVWDMAHQNFKILQESNSLYFLNAECLDALNLKIVDGQPNRLYCYAEVVDKEYCHARKPVNRFRVPQGTKFFRVKVRPLPTKEVAAATAAVVVQSSNTSTTLHMSQSQTTTGSQVSDLATTSSSTPSHSSLPSSPTRSHWEKSESQEAPIPEEKGEDSATTSEKDEEVEKGTELTENFNVENQSSIDR